MKNEYVKLATGYGISLEMNDPIETRGIKMTATTGHSFEMIDDYVPVKRIPWERPELVEFIDPYTGLVHWSLKKKKRFDCEVIEYEE